MTPTDRTLRTPGQLAEAGLMTATEADAIAAVTDRYAVAVTPGLAALIAADPHGAVAKQFIPDAEELITAPDENPDPIGDAPHSPVKGVVHRYPDRALLLPTQVCAVYCRFCFRREAVGPDNGALTDAELDAALDYIRATPAIWEVILTGGDPLILSPRRLRKIVMALDAIPHVQVIRVHSRIPVAAPERITPELLSALRATAKPVYVAVHCNHAAELTPEVRAACARLSDAGIPLLGQSVLLAGVNDSVEALDALMRALVATRIKPYYLSQLDYAPGTRRFRVPLARGRELFRALRGRLSGLAHPTYVLDIPGGAGKVPLNAPHAVPRGDGTFAVTDPAGETHLYPPASPEKG